MKRQIVVLALITLAVTSIALAEPRTFLGGNFGVLANNDDLKTGITGGGQMGVMGDYIEANILALTYNRENKVNKLSIGNVSLTPIMFNVNGRLPLTNRISKEVGALRFGGGFSYVIANHEIDSKLQSELRSFDFKLIEDIKSGIGYQLNGGFDIWVTKSITLGADIFYLWFNSDLRGRFIDLRTGYFLKFEDTIKLDSFIGLATLKYHF